MIWFLLFSHWCRIKARSVNDMAANLPSEKSQDISIILSLVNLEHSLHRSFHIIWDRTESKPNIPQEKKQQQQQKGICKNNRLFAQFGFCVLPTWRCRRYPPGKSVPLLSEFHRCLCSDRRTHSGWRSHGISSHNIRISINKMDINKAF